MAASRRWFGAAAFCVVLMAGDPARAQTDVTLDGTSGNNTVSTAYDTTGGLCYGPGFFPDDLIVAKGGAAPISPDQNDSAAAANTGGGAA